MPVHAPTSRAAITLTALTLLTTPTLLADVIVPVDVPGQGTRRLILHLPANPGNQPLPLILGFHGGGGTAESFRSLTGLNATSDARGFAVAYMDAADGVWGDFRPGPGSPQPDLAYVRAAIDLLASSYNINTRRVYATGLSNGGAFSFVLASELNNRIAAIAPVGHNLTEAFVTQAAPQGPAHILQIVGTADPLMPFNGGTQGPGDIVLSSLASMQYWQAINRNGAPTASLLPNPADDGTFAAREIYAPAPSAHQLQRIIVVNGGHTWPGGLQYLPESVIGLTSRDFSANELIWQFFADKALPPCPADFNLDGTVDFFDYLDFVTAFDANDPSADFNRDGSIDFFDYLDFVALFDRPC